MAAKKAKADESIPVLGRDLATMVVQYVKQETIEPIRGLGRYVGLGLGGVVAGGLGFILLELGLIRLLQTETGTAFRGHLSFVPYVCAMAVSLIVIVIALRGMKPDSSKREV